MSGAADRTFELPEVILHHILSYLPIRDAGRTSVLSKWWNNAWETLPYLNFNDESFMSISEECLEYGKCCKAIGKNRDLLEVVHRIVRSRQHIVKFSLCICPWKDEHLHRRCKDEEDEETKKICSEISSLSFSVMNYLGTPSLKELKLVNGIILCSDLLLPPTLLLSANRLTSLTLKGFNLSYSCNLLDINFTILQKLDLRFLSVDESVFEKLARSMRSSSSLKAWRLRWIWVTKKRD